MDGLDPVVEFVWLVRQLCPVSRQRASRVKDLERRADFVDTSPDTNYVWRPLDQMENRRLEDAYRRRLTETSIRVGRKELRVDLKRMIAIPTGERNKERMVGRERFKRPNVKRMDRFQSEIVVMKHRSEHSNGMVRVPWQIQYMHYDNLLGKDPRPSHHIDWNQQCIGFQLSRQQLDLLSSNHSLSVGDWISFKLVRNKHKRWIAIDICLEQSREQTLGWVSEDLIDEESSEQCLIPVVWQMRKAGKIPFHLGPVRPTFHPSERRYDSRLPVNWTTVSMRDSQVWEWYYQRDTDQPAKLARKTFERMYHTQDTREEVWKRDQEFWVDLSDMMAFERYPHQRFDWFCNHSKIRRIDRFTSMVAAIDRDHCVVWLERPTDFQSWQFKHPFLERVPLLCQFTSELDLFELGLLVSYRLTKVKSEHNLKLNQCVNALNLRSFEEEQKSEHQLYRFDFSAMDYRVESEKTDLFVREEWDQYSSFTEKYRKQSQTERRMKDLLRYLNELKGVTCDEDGTSEEEDCVLSDHSRHDSSVRSQCSDARSQISDDPSTERESTRMKASILKLSGEHRNTLKRVSRPNRRWECLPWKCWSPNEVVDWIADVLAVHPHHYYELQSVVHSKQITGIRLVTLDRDTLTDYFGRLGSSHHTANILTRQIHSLMDGNEPSMAPHPGQEAGHLAKASHSAPPSHHSRVRREMRYSRESSSSSAVHYA